MPPRKVYGKGEFGRRSAFGDFLPPSGEFVGLGDLFGKPPAANARIAVDGVFREKPRRALDVGALFKEPPQETLSYHLLEARFGGRHARFFGGFEILFPDARPTGEPLARRRPKAQEFLPAHRSVFGRRKHRIVGKGRGIAAPIREARDLDGRKEFGIAVRPEAKSLGAEVFFGDARERKPHAKGVRRRAFGKEREQKALELLHDDRRKRGLRRIRSDRPGDVEVRTGRTKEVRKDVAVVRTAVAVARTPKRLDRSPASCFPSSS